MIRTYDELIARPTFQERFEYLCLEGSVGEATFGFDRYLNQMFYNSTEWLRVRDEVIVRDLGCDLGVVGYDIRDRIYVHHMNPIRPEDLIHKTKMVVDPSNLICVSGNTHLAIHYNAAALLRKDPIERRPGDTRLWS